MLDWGESITAGLPDWGPPNNQGTYDPVNTPSGPGNVDTGLHQYPPNQWDAPTVSGYSNQLISDLGLTGAKADFVIFYPNIAQALVQYRIQNNYSPESITFQNWSINYLMAQNPMRFEEFKNVYLNTPESLNLYKIDDLTKLQYPRFAKVVNQLKPYLLANPKVIDGIMNYTGYTREQVLDLATPGRGPKLVVTDNLTIYATGKPDAQYLRWKMDNSGINPILDSNGDKIKEDRIFINKATVEELENGLLQLNPAVEKKMQGLAFLLAITIFHETVHYGRQWNEKNKLDDWTEYGWLLEDKYIGFRVYHDNAGNLVNYNFKLQ
ncbi:hypothetical protein ASF92_20725 [Pedobacter sp. Leaf176]|nr:hypothetical protein ASF92_20725 [Pedobacter sp. Leaf176]